MTWARRVDATHQPITRVLRQCGWDVLDTSRCPGLFDLVARKGGRLAFIECKTGRGALTKSQQELLDRGWPLVILRSEDEARAWAIERGEIHGAEQGIQAPEAPTKQREASSISGADGKRPS